MDIACKVFYTIDMERLVCDRNFLPPPRKDSAMRSIVCLLCALCLAAPALAAPESHTARDVFSRLPESIFENTPEGMDAGEKQELLERGGTDFWEVTADTEHVFEVTALPFRDVAVRLHVFHYEDKDEILAAIGTSGAPICTMELWKEDVNGRIVPVDPPLEPPVEDFFAAAPRVSGQGVKPAVFMCVGSTGLEASVVFWNDAGMLNVRADNAVRFRWDGKNFQKYVVPLRSPADAAATKMPAGSVQPQAAPAPVPAGPASAAPAPAASVPVPAASAPAAPAAPAVTLSSTVPAPAPVGRPLAAPAPASAPAASGARPSSAAPAQPAAASAPASTAPVSAAPAAPSPVPAASAPVTP